MSERLHIALLGAGQLGGSFILALREQGAALFVTAYDPATAHSEALKNRGAVDVVCTTPEEATKDADMVLLAAPLGTYRALAAAIAPVMANGTIVTDLGSVKGSMAAVAQALPSAHIIPAHPIAGSEKSGPAAARGDLFRGKLCILTPDSDTNEQAFRAVEALWEMAGADVIAMPHEVHDQIYAHVSHLPHYIAFVAAQYFHTCGIRIGADEAMLQQFLRIARSNPRMWTDIALENRSALLPALGTYIALLDHFVSELRSGNASPPPARGRQGGGQPENLSTPTQPSPLLGEGETIPTLTKTLLPRVLASCLISGVSLYEQQSATNLRPFGAGGMRDMVAPAALTPEADTEAMSHNAVAMANIIEGIIPRFRALESLIGAEDAPALYASISAMVDDAHAIMSVTN